MKASTSLLRKSFIAGLLLSSVLTTANAASTEIELLVDISGLKSFEKKRYHPNIPFSKNIVLCFDIASDETEPPIIEAGVDIVGMTDSCCLKLHSNSAVVSAGTFKVVKDEKDSIALFDLFSNSSNTREIKSNAPNESAWLDINCSNESLNPLNNFSTHKINRILSGYVKIK